VADPVFSRMSAACQSGSNDRSAAVRSAKRPAAVDTLQTFGSLDSAPPELGDKTPAEMLRSPEGQRAVEQVLERRRGGLPA